jgi:hypothetical protein
MFAICSLMTTSSPDAAAFALPPLPPRPFGLRRIRAWLGQLADIGVGLAESVTDLSIYRRKNPTPNGRAEVDFARRLVVRAMRWVEALRVRLAAEAKAARGMKDPRSSSGPGRSDGNRSTRRSPTTASATGRQPRLSRRSAPISAPRRSCSSHPGRRRRSRRSPRRRAHCWPGRMRHGRRCRLSRRRPPLRARRRLRFCQPPRRRCLRPIAGKPMRLAGA